MIYMMGWNHSENGPAGVFNELKKASEHLKLKNIEFISLSESKSTILKNIVDVLKHNDGTIICIHSGPYLLCFIVCILSKLCRKNKYYLVAHGIYKIESQYISNPIWYVKFCEKYIYKKFQNIICVSDLCKTQITEQYGRKDNIWVIDNGFTFSNIPIVERNELKELKIISLGGIKKWKGFLEAIELVEYINKKLNMKVELSFYGTCNDDDFAIFETLVENKKDISYGGIIRNKNELLMKISQYDIHLALSYQDTFNVAIPEALSVGVPTIATVMCGASKLVENNKNGLVVDLSNDYINDVLTYIQHYVYDGKFRKHNRLYAAKSVAGKDWNEVMKKYYELLNNVYELPDKSDDL